MVLPKHVGIIMDGNGRWARNRNLPRIMGHRNGVKTVDIITEACAEIGIEALTLYAFSTENWKRSKQEVGLLMEILEKNLKGYEKKMRANNIRFNTIGDMEALPVSLQKTIDEVISNTSSNTGMIMTLALNYGGRQEILNAVRSVCRCHEEKKIDIEELEEKEFGEFLYTRGLPDLDLVIRTSGEMRLSNFLIWQAAYAELYVTDTLWPDFNKDELEKAFDEYVARERRFGE